MPKVLEKFDVTLLILGDGPLRSNLLNKIKKFNLKDNIKFFGYTFGEKKLDLLKASDILIMTSLNEGLPVTLLEGLATKKTIITTKVGGIGDLIKNNYNGILIKSKSKEEISNAIIKLFRDSELMEKLSRNAYNMSKNYDWEVISKKYNKLMSS